MKSVGEVIQANMQEPDSARKRKNINISIESKFCLIFTADNTGPMTVQCRITVFSVCIMLFHSHMGGVLGHQDIYPYKNLRKSCSLSFL